MRVFVGVLRAKMHGSLCAFLTVGGGCVGALCVRVCARWLAAAASQCSNRECRSANYQAGRGRDAGVFVVLEIVTTAYVCISVTSSSWVCVNLNAYTRNTRARK